MDRSRAPRLARRRHRSLGCAARRCRAFLRIPMLTEPLALQPDHRPDPQVLRRSIEYHLHYTVGKNPAAAPLPDWRSEERRAGKEGVSTVKARWRRSHKKKKT